METPRSVRPGPEESSDCLMPAFDNTFAVDRFFGRDILEWNGTARVTQGVQAFDEIEDCTDSTERYLRLLQ